jgi:hypothetical protein
MAAAASSSEKRISGLGSEKGPTSFRLNLRQPDTNSSKEGSIGNL